MRWSFRPFLQSQTAHRSRYPHMCASDPPATRPGVLQRIQVGKEAWFPDRCAAAQYVTRMLRVRDDGIRDDHTWYPDRRTTVQPWCLKPDTLPNGTDTTEPLTGVPATCPGASNLVNSHVRSVFTVQKLKKLPEAHEHGDYRLSPFDDHRISVSP